MRVRLNLWLWLLVLATWLGAAPVASAEDRVTVRGNYYREQSTRVLSPELKMTVDVPDERLTLGAAYMLDAVTSASIATGTTAVTGGDNTFTEIRHEATVSAASRLGDWQLGSFFRYSTETDWQSRSIGVSGGRDLLQRTINLSLSYAYNFDRVFRIFDGFGRRLPWCGGNTEPNCRDGGFGDGSNLLRTHYVSAGYSHILTRNLLSVFTVEYANAQGPMDNPYRGEQLPGIEFEKHPNERNRVTLFGSLRYAVAKGRATLEPRYRFYADDWGIRGHSIDPRVHVRVTPNLRVRFRYRFYTQSEASFFRDDMQYVDTDAPCRRGSTEGCASADVKVDDWRSHTGGVQLTYGLDGLAAKTEQAWLEGAWVQATYNYVHQTNRFGPVRALGSLAFSMPF
jgi:hypothetical protein